MLSVYATPPFRYSTEFSPAFGGVLAEDHSGVTLGPWPRYHTPSDPLQKVGNVSPALT